MRLVLGRWMREDCCQLGFGLPVLRDERSRRKAGEEGRRGLLRLRREERRGLGNNLSRLCADAGGARVDDDDGNRLLAHFGAGLAGLQLAVAGSLSETRGDAGGYLGAVASGGCNWGQARPAAQHRGLCGSCARPDAG